VTAPAGAGLARLLAGLSDERRREVLTHRSWARRGRSSYERLEFLGDSALEVIVRAELMRRHPDADEGDLSWMRQGVVNREVCARVADRAGLDRLCLAQAPTARREAAGELVRTVNVRGALAEAVIGAAWLELGPEVTTAAVIDGFADALDAVVPGVRDPKTSLQEEAARRHVRVAYELVGQEGPPQSRVFTSRVRVDGRVMGEGSGSSKQASEQGAAREALASLGAPTGAVHG
jgi:ribonuclease III